MGLPAIPDKKADLEREERFREALADAIHAGKRPAEIARQMAPNDRARQKAIRTRVRRMLYSDAQLAVGLSRRAQVEFLMNLGDMSRAVSSRASRGRIDAARFMAEASGFHNPRVRHEHSGEINIKLDVPRPSYEDTRSEEVTDADVVD